MLTIRHLSRPGKSVDQPPLLHPVDLDVALGECVVVSGPSGSGKTMLLRAIADLDPNDGEISLDGADRADTPAPEWRRKAVFQPAETGWWSDITGDHFDDHEAARDYFETLDLAPDCLEWPVSRLSTGERQRLGLIRSLLVAPRVLLLDEPTSALDPGTTERVEGLLRERLRLGNAMIITSHDLDQAARLNGRRLIMEDRRLRPVEDAAR